MRLFLLLCLPLVLLLSTQPAAAENTPVIAIIIDDLGNQLVEDRRAIALPGPVACAFLPDTPYAARLARRAHAAGKEVLLHLPLEAISHKRLGPGGLKLHMTRREFATTVRADLAAVPDLDGVNNHMGSLMTQHPGDMAWLMAILKQHPSLFYVDSRTTPRTVAYKIAEEYGVPATSRDVFLDDMRTEAAIAQQFDRLVAIAKDYGTAVAIGHPYPVTMRTLKKLLPELAARGVKLVSVRTVIERQTKAKAKAEASTAHP